MDLKDIIDVVNNLVDYSVHIGTELVNCTMDKIIDDFNTDLYLNTKSLLPIANETDRKIYNGFEILGFIEKSIFRYTTNNLSNNVTDSIDMKFDELKKKYFLD